MCLLDAPQMPLATVSSPALISVEETESVVDELHVTPTTPGPPSTPLPNTLTGLCFKPKESWRQDGIEPQLEYYTSVPSWRDHFFTAISGSDFVISDEN